MLSKVSHRQKLLIVGQTPPPLHGQAMMIRYLVQGEYPNLQIKHVRMNFSKSIEDVGRFGFSKLTELVWLILQIWYWRFQGYNNLYYPPASGQRMPILRDICILLSTRFLFRKLIFHFHSGDLVSAYRSLTFWMRPLFRWTYHRCDLAILVAHDSGLDPTALRPARWVVIPNAIADDAAPDGRCDSGPQGVVHSKIIPRSHPYPPATNTANVPPVVILYLGSVSEEKGLLILLSACGLLKQRGIKFELRVAGGFQSNAFEQVFFKHANQYGLDDDIRIMGVIDCSNHKQKVYQAADIFCFPTFYSAETFGLVVVEAMSHRLPVVASRWRGVGEVVLDGETGFLVPPKDPQALANRLQQLVLDPQLRAKMGQAGRCRFLKNFTLAPFREQFSRQIAATLAK